MWGPRTWIRSNVLGSTIPPPPLLLPFPQVFPIPEDDGPRPDLPDKQAWTGAALSQIDDLHTLGFTQSQCLEAVTAMGTLDRDALIEWLLLHLAPKDIPRVFALQSASESGDVAVLHKADPAARESARALGAMAREAPEPRGPALQELKAEAAAHEPASDQKAWILQHLEAAGSSSGDSDDSRSRVGHGLRVSSSWVSLLVGPGKGQCMGQQDMS